MVARESSAARNVKRQADDGQSSATTDRLPTRQSLLSRLGDWGDETSWQEFFDTYWRLIYSVARRAGLSDAEAHDVVQETVLSVAKSIGRFRYDPKRGSFKGWLLQLTGWRIHNQLRRRSPECVVAEVDFPEQSDASGEGPGLAVAPELEQVWDQEWEDQLLLAALERVRARVNPKHFQIFDFYVLQHRGVSEICEFLEVSRTEVYLAKHRIGRIVRQERARLQGGLL